MQAHRGFVQGRGRRLDGRMRPAASEGLAMDIRDEVKKVRPSVVTILAGLARFLALLAVIAAYYRYFEDKPSPSMPALLVCVACLAFACLGSLRTELRYRVRLGRLLRRIDKTC